MLEAIFPMVLSLVVAIICGPQVYFIGAICTAMLLEQLGVLGMMRANPFLPVGPEHAVVICSALWPATLIIIGMRPY